MNKSVFRTFQTYKMKRFAKIINGCTIVGKINETMSRNQAKLDMTRNLTTYQHINLSTYQVITHIKCVIF